MITDRKNVVLTKDLLGALAELDDRAALFRGMTGAGPDPAELAALRRTLVASAGASTRLEGSRLSDADVEALIVRRARGERLRRRDEQEVAGCLDLLETVFDNHEHIPLTENYIRQLHKILLMPSEKDTRHRGRYKTSENALYVSDADWETASCGIFLTASAFDTPRFMESLVAWTNEELDLKILHPVLIIGVFIVHFLAIHPFMDGNGRLSRALTNLLMLRQGYSHMPYASMEAAIEAERDGYYRALREAQKTIWGDAPDYTAWLAYFVDSLVRQARGLPGRIA
ncbi:MAG: Fic family protein [Desulfovibrionaceae bacterium]|nr:Fic family protein [Desulfovibrionaceae bacterium]